MQEKRKSPRTRSGKGSQEDQALTDRRGVFDAAKGERKRRRAIRHSCRAAIQRLVRYATGQKEFKARMLDISVDGAMLFVKVFSEKPFEVGQDVWIAIELSDGSTIEAAGEVRWVRAVPQRRGHAGGVHFTSIGDDDKQKLVQFLSELDETLGL